MKTITPEWSRPVARAACQAGGGGLVQVAGRCGAGGGAALFEPAFRGASGKADHGGRAMGVE